MKSSPRKFQLTADILLRAYSIGVFPMAESREAKELFWVEPHERGVFPLDKLVVSRSLAKTVRSDRFRVLADRDFPAVMRACADRESTWINDEILRLYCSLFDAGHAHSIEVYEGNALVGGLYGVSLRGAFFGESMFHRAPDASKVALVHLFARLRAGGYRLLDTQFLTDHLARLGAVAVSRETFRLLLAQAMAADGDFGAWPPDAAMPGARALEIVRASGTEAAVGGVMQSLGSALILAANCSRKATLHKLGGELVEGRDLFGEDDQVFMRATLGPRRVEVNLSTGR